MNRKNNRDWLSKHVYFTNCSLFWINRLARNVILALCIIELHYASVWRRRWWLKTKPKYLYLTWNRKKNKTINILVCAFIRCLFRQPGYRRKKLRHSICQVYIEKLIPKTTTPDTSAYASGGVRVHRVRLGSKATRQGEMTREVKGFNLDPEKKSARLLFSSIGLLQPTLYIRWLWRIVRHHRGPHQPLYRAYIYTSQ